MMCTFEKAMKFLLVAVVLTIGGCAWQRIPPPPSYVAPTPLPIRIGVVLDDSQASAYYGPAVVNLWKEMRVFESITYPYREGDPVDGILRLAINGGWRGQGAGAGFLVGLTLGLASPAVGPSMTGIHDATTIVSRSTEEVARYSVRVESTVTWGLAANTSEVSSKAEDLQRRKIAVELAQKLNADRPMLVKAFPR